MREDQPFLELLKGEVFLIINKTNYSNTYTHVLQGVSIREVHQAIPAENTTKRTTVHM